MAAVKYEAEKLAHATQPTHFFRCPYKSRLLSSDSKITHFVLSRFSFLPLYSLYSIPHSLCLSIMPAQAQLPMIAAALLKDTPTSSPAPSPKRLEGKIAIVTGGARGIGEATVRLFARQGARVVIGDVEDVLGRALASSLAPLVTFVRCDVSSEEDVEHLISSTVSLFGRLDIIFNNAGILGNQSEQHKSIVDFDADEFDRIMKVNVKGVALGMKHAARVMIPRRTGCIISTASVASVLGGLGPHSYTASKHAIVGLTKNAACELGKHGIRVNCISPFGVATRMLINAWRESNDDEQEGDVSNNPSGGEVEKLEEMVRGMANLKGPTLRASDVAEAAVYLASEESRYISGHNLVVDGGITSSINLIHL